MVRGRSRGCWLRMLQRHCVTFMLMFCSLKNKEFMSTSNILLVPPVPKAAPNCLSNTRLLYFFVAN